MSSYRVDRKHWAKLNIFEQMGNIYSEVGRSYNAKKRGDKHGCEQAVIRALDLFDATVDALIQKNNARAKEVLRSKDQFLHTIYDDNVSSEELASLDKYFMHFALAARLHR